MISNAVRRITGVLLAVAIPLCWAFPAHAANAYSDKEEVVYVKLSHDGRVDTIYVVNSFDMPQGGTIVDTGSYTEVRNLTTTDTIRYADNMVSVAAPQGKFYYEGVLENREIPWSISVEYRLDGKPISGDRLAGQSGALRIDLRIHQNGGVDPVYGDNYAIQASMSLDGERCSNIVAQDATIASVGKNKQLSWIILPGKEGDYTITANVVNFEMDGISINGIPLSLSIDDPDTDEIKDKIAELQDGAIELDDGAWELDDGARELGDGAEDLDAGATRLDDGVLSLEDGVEELEDGVEELQDGAWDLRDGAHELYEGTRDLREGVDELEDGVTRLSRGAATFGEGLSALHAQSETLAEGSTRMMQGLQALQEGLSGMNPQFMEQKIGRAAALQTGSQQYLDTLDLLIDRYEDQLRQSLTLGASGSGETDVLQGTIDTLKELRDGYAEINTAVAALGGEVIAQGNSLPTLAESVQELTEQYALLHSGLTFYTQGVDQLYGSYGQIAGGVSDLSNGVDDLSDGARDLRSGARELYDGTWDLQDGVNRLADGTIQLRDGATELRDGTIEMKDGTLELLDGTQELLDGTLELLDGTTELREKTADMDQEIDDRIDELLDEYRGTEFDAVSFVDSSTKISSVQFVMLTESITVDDATAEAVVQAEPVKPTLWQRFLGLFSFLWS